MAIKFDINYTCSPLAQSGKLYYRYMKADGTYSSWVFDTTLGIFPINTVGGTVLNQTIPDVTGNPPGFYPNTAYEFYIKQTCQDGTIEDSAPSDDIYIEKCPPISLYIDFTYSQGSYQMQVTLYDITGPGNPLNPFAAGISEYTFKVFWIPPPGAVGCSGSGPEFLGTYPQPPSFITPAYISANQGPTSFSFYITSPDLSQQCDGQVPFQAFQQYYVQLVYSIVTPGGKIEVECDPLDPITIPDCRTYRIYTGPNWLLDYRDCNGIVRRIGDDNPVGGVDVDAVAPYFYICSQVTPVGYTCVQGAAAPTPAVVGFPNNTYPITGLQSYPWLVPVISGAVVESPINNSAGCDTIYNDNFPQNLLFQNVTDYTPNNC